MAKVITIEAYFLTVTLPKGLSDAEFRAVRRTLAGTRFRARLAEAVERVLRHFPSLAKARSNLSR